MNQTNDPDMQFERPEYGETHYEEQSDYGEVETDYADSGISPEKPKSNALLNIAIFGGVVIFALVMAYINFGSVLFPKTEGAPAVDAAAMLNPAVPTAEPQPVVSPPADPNAPVAAAPAPFSADPNVPLSGAAPVGADPVATPASPVVPADAAAVPPVATSPAPVVGAPATPTDVANLSVTPPAVSPTAPATPAAPAPDMAGGTPASPAVPLPTMPDMGHAATVPPMAVAPAPAVASPSPVVDSTKLAELEKQNQELVAKAAEQETTIADLKAQLADVQDKLAKASSGPKTEAATSKPKKAKKKVVKKPAEESSSSASSLGVLSEPGNAQTKAGGTLGSPPPYWVLRSASDNSAWVAHPGDSQLYQVTVGDQLPGIGKIISIQQQNGTWVVVGTQGVIRP